VPVPTLAVEAPVVELEKSEADAPTIEVTGVADADAQELVGASSMSAQVVPIENQQKRKRRTKKKPAIAVATTPVVEDAPEAPAPSSARGYWFALLGAAALVGWWIASGSRSEAGETALAEAPAAAHQPIDEPAPKLAAPPPTAPQVEPIAPQAEPIAPQAQPPAPVAPQAEPALPAVAKETEPAAPTQPASEAEPARLTAYKAVMAATKTAGNCRYRGDSSGKVPVVVEFGGDGRVQRTMAKGTFANPMTSQCIVSKFSSLTVPGTLPAPIIITADVTLR
jgi:hypothetical protein